MQKNKKLALNSWLQTYQILTSDDQMLILRLSYFVTTVNIFLFKEGTIINSRRILVDWNPVFQTLCPNAIGESTQTWWKMTMFMKFVGTGQPNPMPWPPWLEAVLPMRPSNFWPNNMCLLIICFCLIQWLWTPSL